MEECTIDNDVSILADDQSTAVAKPCKCAFYLPSPFVATQFATIMIFASLVVASIGTDQFDATTSQTFSKRIAVISPVRNESFRIFPWPAASFSRDGDSVQSCGDQLHFRWGRRVQVVSKRNTLAVDHHHPLRAFALAGLADTEPPFFAGAKLPSMKASDQSNWPRSSNSARKARQAFNQTSCSSQSRSRRQQVEGLGYVLGKSAHGAPVRSIQRIPSKTLRLSIQGRPPRLDVLGFGKSGSSFFHCASVNFQRCFAIEKTPFNDNVDISCCLAQVYIPQILRL